MAQTITFPKMPEKAATAFADYIAMGPDRSLGALCERYRKATGPIPTKRLMTLKDWSRNFRWQDRIKGTVNERIDALTEQAYEIDAESFFLSSRLINERLKYSSAVHADVIVKMRESVRKPAPKTPAESTIKHSGTVTHIHRDMSQFTDDEIASLAAVAERSKAERF
jgi:hypothetical protein